MGMNEREAHLVSGRVDRVRHDRIVKLAVYLGAPALVSAVSASHFTNGWRPVSDLFLPVILVFSGKPGDCHRDILFGSKKERG